MIRLGTSSYIIPADIIPNVDYLKDKVDDIELVLFESSDASNIPSSDMIKRLDDYARAWKEKTGGKVLGWFEPYFPEEVAYKNAQDSIEQRLRSFNQDLWVPSLEVLQARAEAEEKARAEAEGEVTEGEEGSGDQVEGDAGEKDVEEKAVTRTTKRGSKSKDADTKKSSSKTKSKKSKVKERKPKTSTQTANTGVRSVRNRKK